MTQSNKELFPILVLQNEKGQLLFANRTYDDKTFFTLVDKKGRVVSSAEISVTIDEFQKVMHKAGFKEVSY